MANQPENVDSILCTAVEIDSPDQRVAYLDEACGGDAALRAEVEKLLSAHFRAGSFLQRPVAGERPAQVLDALTDREGLPDPMDPLPEVSLDFLEPCDVPGRLGMLGPYEVIEVIGRGGMGVVLRAHDPKLNRVVAVKVLAPEFAANPTARKRFRRESQAAAAVSHDHVVAIHSVDEAAELPLLVMEYIDGVSLEERIKRSGPLELKEILRIGVQTASGLAAAHAQGLVHRDIKPANILLENGVERVKITDFGLARAAGDVQITHTGVVTGTPQYMSPEQAKAEVLDHRSDLFSFGSVLYAMCTGRPPFRTTTILDAIRRVCEDTPRPIRKVNPEIPEWLVEIIDKLLAKDPQDRFQTASEVAELLGQHLAHLQQPEAVPQPPRVGPAKKTRRRAVRGQRRLRWAVAAAVLALLLGGLGLTEATGVTDVREFLATVLRIKTPQGTLVVKIDDPNVKVVVDGAGNAITLTGIGDHEITLRPGRHQWQAIKEGKAVQSEWVNIEVGGKQVVEVSLLPPSPPGEKQQPSIRFERPDATVTVKLRATLRRHIGGVYSVAFSPDGKTLASSGDQQDQTIILWDSETGQEQRILTGHADIIQDVTFSPDGRTLASASQDASIKLWDPRTGQERATLRGNLGMSGINKSVVFSPNGKWLACSGGSIKLWNLETGREKELPLDQFIEGPLPRFFRLAYSPDGQTLASTSHDGMIRLWDARMDREPVTLTGHTPWPSDVAFSPDGKTLAVSSCFHVGTIKLWDLKTGQERATLVGHGFGVPSVVFSPDGKMLASGSYDHKVKLWDVQTGQQWAHLAGHTREVHGVAFSPNGKTLASASFDRTIKLWDIETIPRPATKTLPGEERETNE